MTIGCDNLNYETVFESKNICFININKALVNDYLEMVNNPEVSKYISLKNRIFTYDDELK